MFEIREIKNEEEYDPLLISKNAPFTQAWFFGEWQKAMGREVIRFEIKQNSETIGFFQAIKYPLAFSKNFLYIPHGPVLRSFDSGEISLPDFLKEFRKKLFEIGKGENVVFIRFDFYSHYPNYGSKENLKKYFCKIPDYVYHSSYFQPKREWILNLEKSEGELLTNMRPKTRYNINLAENKNVKIEISTNLGDYFADFYKLLKKTAERNRFGLHPELYYQNIFFALGGFTFGGKNCAQNKNAFLAVARYSNKILAINMILLFGETAHFLYGGSSDELKNLMAPHLAHWQAIKEAKKRGFKFYNFGAVDSERFEGISRFKRGFGGELLEYFDSYDLIFKPVWYNLYRFSKSIRQTI